MVGAHQLRVSFYNLPLDSLTMRVNASRQASAGEQTLIRSPNTEVPMSTVKSTSSNDSCDRTRVECQIAYRNDMPLYALSASSPLLLGAQAYHEDVVCRQEGIVDQLHPMELPVDLQDSLTGLRHLHEDQLLVLLCFHAH